MANRRATSRVAKSAVSALRTTAPSPAQPPHGPLSHPTPISGSSFHPGTALPGLLIGARNGAVSSPVDSTARVGGSRVPLHAPCFVRFVSSSQTNPTEYTEMTWEGIIGAVDAARAYKQEVVETEHLMEALLEQKDGLRRRILTKAGLDNSSVLQAVEDFIAQQPKVAGHTSGPIMGPSFSSLLESAHKYKKGMGDNFVPVEHLLLAFH